MSAHSLLARPRRSFTAVVAAAALATVGIAVGPPASVAATASPAATVTITPSSAPASTVTAFTLRVTGGTGTATDDKASRVEVGLPTGYTAPSVTAGSMASPWTVSYDSANSDVVFTSNDNAVDLASGQVLTATLSVKTPTAAGVTTFTTSAFKNKNSGGTGNSATTGANPTVTVTATSQTITFGALTNKTYGDPDFTVSATGGASGNPVTFTAAGTCTAGGTNGATIHLTGAGSCDVTAHQAGGNGYTAAPDVTRTFSIAQASQSISFAAISTKTFGDGPLTLSATGGGSGNPVTFTASGTCSVSGTSLTLTGAGTCTVNADQAGNTDYLAAQRVSRTFTVNKASAVLTLSGLNRTYNGSPQGATVTTDPAGLGGVTVTYAGSSTVPTKAGTYAVVASLDNPDYGSEQAIGSLVINKLHITGSFTVGGRQYDGTTAAQVTGRSLDGVVAGDDVALSGGTATFNSKNAGLRTATLSGYSLSGNDASNYELDGVGPATATIARREVTGTIAAGDKTYDGTLAATVTQRSIIGKIGSDDVDLDVTGAVFDGAGAGTHLVTAAIALTGTAKDDYILSSSTASADASIWKAELTGSWTASSRAYDGTTDAHVKSTSLPGVVSNEDVTLVVSDATFDSKDVGTDRDVTATLSLGGTDIANYVLANAGSSTVKADITPAALTGSVTADSRVYDGGTDAAAHPAGLTGVIGSEDVVLVVDSASFGTKVVGTGKTVTAHLSLAGSDTANYTVNGTATTTADITRRTVDGSFSAADKVYNGNNAAEITDRSLAPADGDTGKISTDTLSLTGGSATFADKNVGNAKTVTGTGFALGGGDADNYTLGTVPTTTADITKRTVDGSFTAGNKVYDGTTAASITGRSLTDASGDTGKIAEDQVTLTDGTATFGTKDVGTAKTVTGTGFALNGDDAGNYTLGTVPTTTANITVRHLTGSFTSHDKVYDGDNTATITDRTLDDVVGTENVTLAGGTATFASRNAGTWDVALSGATLGGTDKDNYVLDGVTKGTAQITAKQLTGSFTAASKVYDGTMDATVNGRSLPGVLGTDAVSLVVTNPLFGTKTAGTGKTVSGTLSLIGAQAGNYSLSSNTASTTADISRRDVAGWFTAADKAWDGNTSATISGWFLADASLNSGKVAGDSLTLTGGSAAFNSASVGTGKTVTGSGFTLSGGDAGNYTLSNPQPWTAVASITEWYKGSGFYAPVDITPASATAPVYNTIKGGQTVPLKFEVFAASNSVEVTDVSFFGSTATTQAAAFKIRAITCSATAAVDAVEVTTTGGTALRYDGSAGQFIQNWKTPTNVGSCYAVSVTATDGTTVGPAYFKITK